MSCQEESAFFSENMPVIPRLRLSLVYLEVLLVEDAVCRQLRSIPDYGGSLLTSSFLMEHATRQVRTRRLSRKPKLGKFYGPCFANVSGFWKCQSLWTLHPSFRGTIRHCPGALLRAPQTSKGQTCSSNHLS
jgi:hypothetical protein